jgi:uncharacterized protein YciI
MNHQFGITAAVLCLVGMNASALAADAPAKQREVAQTVVCVDVPDSWPLRKKITGEHLKYIDSIKDKIRIGGPVRGPDGLPNGSIIVYATASLDEAKVLLAADPFSRNALFARCDWYPFVQYVGTYVGGWAEPK